MAITQVLLTNTFDEWRTRTNQLIEKNNFNELAVPDLYLRSNSTNLNVASAFAKANGVALGANAYTNAVTVLTGAGANSYANVVWSRANARSDLVGVSANSFTSATISGANSFILSTLSGANSITFSTIAGANAAIGAGANAFSRATIAGANAAVGLGANSFAAATIAGANAAIGAGANARSLINSTATIAGTLTSTGSFVAGTFDGRDDSASAPAFRFVNGQSMGMYRAGVNTLGFATAGVARMSISATGRITGSGTSGSSGFNGTGDRFISGTTPASGQDGDIWYKV